MGTELEEMDELEEEDKTEPSHDKFCLYHMRITKTQVNPAQTRSLVSLFVILSLESCYIHTFKSFCYLAGKFESYLYHTSKERFSHVDVAHKYKELEWWVWHVEWVKGWGPVSKLNDLEAEL